MKILNIILGLGLIALSGCGPSAEEKAAEESKKLSETLLEEINKAMENHEYGRVILLSDSLDRACPKETAAREKALKSWKAATLEMLKDSALMLDAKLDSITTVMETMKPDFIKRDNPIESYRIVKSISSTPLVSKTGVEPRLGSADELWTLVANVNGSKPGIVGLQLVENGTVIVRLMADNAEARRATETSGEMFTFNAEEAGPIAAALENASVNNLKLELLTKGKNVPIPLTKSLAEAIVKTYTMARLREERQTVLKERELISRKIQVAEDQNQ